MNKMKEKEENLFKFKQRSDLSLTLKKLLKMFIKKKTTMK